MKSHFPTYTVEITNQYVKSAIIIAPMTNWPIKIKLADKVEQQNSSV